MVTMKTMDSEEYNYLNLLEKIIISGQKRIDRTGAGTLSIFAPDPLRFNISQSVPLLTTKKMAWKTVIKELLWFLRGDTDAKILQKQNVHIWDKNTDRSFLDSRGLDYPDGVLGPGYGWSWRFFGAEYSPDFSDTSKVDTSVIGGFDQIKFIENELKTNPFSRRIYLNAWNPGVLDIVALPPCHIAVQFYAEQVQDVTVGNVGVGADGVGSVGAMRLSAHLYMRSNDMFLGNPFNIFSYAVLTYIIAKKCGMTPHELVVSFGDAHIYLNHIDQVKTQLQRKPYNFPQLKLDDSIIHKDYKDITIDDFTLIDYKSLPGIKADMNA
jgi:thymidylate synthase